MKRIFLFFILASLLLSCSKPKQFLVLSIKDAQTIELEDGTLVTLIGVNGTTNKYVHALQGLQNNYILLYDENYDAVKEIYEGSIMAYVYDMDGNCINNFAEDGTGSISVSSSLPVNGPTPVSQKPSIQEETKERVSGKVIEQGVKPQSLSELYNRNKNAVFLIAVFQSETEYSQGSGFFIDAKGIGVSNYHVFKDGIEGEAYAKTIDNIQYRIGKILQFDEDLDFIVFEVENEHLDFPFLKIANEKTRIGEDVFAIGNPQGLEHTLSRGIVSSYRENDTKIQTTADITHGSSGGPLFNMDGEVIGITTSGVGEANLNFAMNIQILDINNR
jgi:Trypsin-like peptidase domain